MKLARAELNGTPAPLIAALDGDDDGWHLTTTPLSDILDGVRPVLGERIQVADLLAPLRPGNVIGIGLNYADMVAQMGWATPTEPFLFPKYGSSVIGPERPILIDPSITRRVDWEGELAVIIGKRAHRVSQADALHHVFGYTVANDISARDLQERDGQWVRGKAMDTFCPLGPWAVTADRIPDPQRLRIRTRIDGDVVQDGTTSDMIFPIEALISYVSSYITLEPGDVILTGTPAGCGEWSTPPRHLHPGSVVEVEVEGIGCLRNHVERDPVARAPEFI